MSAVLNIHAEASPMTFAEPDADDRSGEDMERAEDEDRIRRTRTGAGSSEDGKSVPPSPALTRVTTNDSESRKSAATALDEDRDRGVHAEKDHQHQRSRRHSDDRVSLGEILEIEAEKEPEEHWPLEKADLDQHVDTDLDMDTDVDVDGMKMRERPVEHPLKFEVTGTRTPPRPINTPLPASEHEGAGRTDSFDQRKDKKEAFSLPMSQPQPPRSSYYYGPPADDSAFGTEPMGTIGTHYPREIIRVERDYESGELCQFATAYPLELEGRITPTEFLESINAINEILISAHSTLAAFVDNTVAVLTLYISNLFWTTQYDRSMKRLAGLIDELNAQTFNPRGLNILWPRRVAFLFLEIEYY